MTIHVPVPDGVALIDGGLATLPLVAISDVGEMGVARALAAMSERLTNEASPAQQSMLLASTRMLMGLRFGIDEINQTLGRIEMSILGIRGIEESSTYKEIFSKGEARGEATGEARGEAKGKFSAVFVWIAYSTRFKNPPRSPLRTGGKFDSPPVIRGSWRGFSRQPGR